MRGRARTWLSLAAAVLLAVVLYGSTFVVSYGDLLRRQDPLLAADVARIAPARVAAVAAARDVEQLQAVLRDARQRGLKVSVAGSRHSQGGHTYTAGGVVLNMRTFNRVLAIDTITPAGVEDVYDCAGVNATNVLGYRILQVLHLVFSGRVREL